MISDTGFLITRTFKNLNATGLETRKGDGYGYGWIILPVQQVSYGPLIMSIMLMMSCYTGFFNVRRGWQSLDNINNFRYWFLDNLDNINNFRYWFLDNLDTIYNFRYCFLDNLDTINDFRYWFPDNLDTINDFRYWFLDNLDTINNFRYWFLDSLKNIDDFRYWFLITQYLKLLILSKLSRNQYLKLLIVFKLSRNQYLKYTINNFRYWFLDNIITVLRMRCK
jgi:hypothetical protein